MKTKIFVFFLGIMFLLSCCSNGNNSEQPTEDISIEAVDDGLVELRYDSILGTSNPEIIFYRERGRWSVLAYGTLLHSIVDHKVSGSSYSAARLSENGTKPILDHIVVNDASFIYSDKTVLRVGDSAAGGKGYVIVGNDGFAKLYGANHIAITERPYIEPEELPTLFDDLMDRNYIRVKTITDERYVMISKETGKYCLGTKNMYALSNDFFDSYGQIFTNINDEVVIGMTKRFGPKSKEIVILDVETGKVQSRIYDSR